MEMNYFRFLFCESREGLVHYGELKDTRREENYRFFYLKDAGVKNGESGAGRRQEIGQNGVVEMENTDRKNAGKKNTGRQEKAGECAGQYRDSAWLPFLYPEFVDLVVVGEWNAGIQAALERITEQCRIGKLVCPKSREYGIPKRDAIENIVRLADTGESAERELCIAAAGRRFLAVCVEDNQLLFLHVPEYGSDEKKESCRDRAEGCGPDRVVEHAETKSDCSSCRNLLFEDCVMQVKRLNASLRCASLRQPDAYGCALGCTLHRDYDDCSCRGMMPDERCPAGVLLVPGNLDSQAARAEKIRRFTKQILDEYAQDIRFFVSPEPDWILREAGLQMGTDGNADERKRYFVGSEYELGGSMAAAVCGRGFCRVPVLLKEGEGICCSGFFRYRESSGAPVCTQQNA